MFDRLILWLVIAAPILVVVGAVLHRRWKAMPPTRRLTELGWAWLGLGLLLIGLVLYESWLSHQPEVRRVHFHDPRWIALLPVLVPLLLWLQAKSLAGLSRGRLWTSFLLRSAILSLLVLAVAGLQMVVESDTMTVLFAIDRSKSVPDSEAKRALDYIRQVLPTKRADDRAGLLIFGGDAAVQVLPKETFASPELAALRAEIQPDATSIDRVLRKSRVTFPEETAKRLVLFTDGEETGGSSAQAGQDAVLNTLKTVLASGVDVWVVPLGRSDAPEMLIAEISMVDPQINWGVPIQPKVKVVSNVSGKARVTLNTGEQTISVVQDVKPGDRNFFDFPAIKLQNGGPHEIQAILEPLDPALDTLAGNNHAYTFTDVQSESRILILASSLEDVAPLRKAMQGEKVELDIRTGGGMPEDPEELRHYDCIVLANLSREFLSPEQMAVIESCVKDQGAGLVMIGGDQSFGAGGYLNTPVERALPVSMDLKNQKVMPSGALGIVLHTCEFAEGNSWGKKISKAAIDVLSPQDYAGLLYFGWGAGTSGETWLFVPTLVQRKRWMFSLIDGCEPGDMPDLDKIVSMAVKGLTNLSNVSLKHCIIITDGDPSPPTAGTLAAAKKGKITITVITIAPHGGADVAAMKNIAEQTGGSYYSPSDPRKLPQIFVKEAAIVRKSLIHQDDRGIPVNLGSPGEILREFGSDFPKVKAFVVTSLRDRAEQHLWSTVEGEKIPVLARWHYGLGRAVAFTSDTGARWASDWVSWGNYDKFWANLFHWVCRQRMPAQHTIQAHVEGDTARVMVEALTPEGRYKEFASLTGSASEPRMGQDPNAKSLPLTFRMTAPGRYEATFPVNQQGAYTVSVLDLSDPAKPNSIVTGLAKSYSKEYELNQEEGGALLRKMGAVCTEATTTWLKTETGEARLRDLEDLSVQARQSGLFKHNLPLRQRPKDFFWPLLLAALLLLPFDIAVRRLNIDPLIALAWLGEKLAPLVGVLRRKKDALAQAATEAARSAAEDRAPPPPIVPSGSQSREAHSRYEQAGDSDEAKGLDLSGKPAEATKPAAVGGTKLSPADEAASEYTRALLKAKKKARRDRM